mgnify:CR=1 FL=1
MYILKMLREKKGISQRDIAKYINKSPQAYSLYETGKRDLDTETLKKLADFYGVSIDYLLGREIPISSPKSIEITLEDIDLLEKMKNLPPEKRKAMELLLGFAENVETGSN